VAAAVANAVVNGTLFCTLSKRIDRCGFDDKRWVLNWVRMVWGRRKVIGSWYHQTRQVWKLYVFLLLTLLCIVAAVAGLISDIFEDSRGRPVIALCSVILAVVTFAWVIWAIQCPRCQGRPALRIFNSGSAADWFTRLISLQECPICSDSAATGEPKTIVRAGQSSSR
jgi:hypothetical protein